ncbi:AAA family ATPase [Bacillus toyonensis]|uniref:AAA family ATPase n=1 Tax=Bacillus toyonensis TaxID=155322 RepID=UPI002E1FF5AC|nr:AAA family ATPase [Bacillus toyonensis]MED2737461.1 AAA family ATPase [Bacillus toyonensis]
MNGIQMKKMIVAVSKAIANKEFRSLPHFEKPPFVFWGPKGSGKTKTVKAAGTINKFPVINIRLGQELAEDMSYPEVVEINGEKFLSKIIAEMFPRYNSDEKGNRIPRKKIVDGKVVTCEGEFQINFEKIKAYIENYKELEEYYTSLGLSINDAPGAIVFLDEVNRIEDKQMFQMIFQLFDSGKFKGYVTPEEISFFAAANPNKGYIVSNWFADPAFTNRCVHLKTRYDFASWLEYATAPGSGFDELTIEFYKANPKALFDEKENNFDLPKFSSSYRNPTFLSLYVNGVDYQDDEIKTEILTAIIGEMFVANFHQVEEKLQEYAPSAEEIFENYAEYDLGDNPLIGHVTGKAQDGTPIYQYEIDTLINNIDGQVASTPLRDRILKYLEDNRQDVINEICENMVNYIYSNYDQKGFLEDLETNTQRKLKFIRFMFDLPRGKFATTFQQIVANPEADKKEKSENIASHLTKGEAGKYLVNLIKYNQKRVALEN